MSAPEIRQMAAKAVQMARKGVESGAKTLAKRHPSHYGAILDVFERLLPRISVLGGVSAPRFAFQGAPAPASSIALRLRWAFSRFIPNAAQHICACTFAVPK